MQTKLRVTHVGPFGPEPGGIAAVIRNYLEWRWPTTEHRVLRSYAPGARLFSLGPFLAALGTLITGRRGDLGVVHVHLSQRGAFIREGALVVVASLRRLPVCTTIHGSAFEKFLDGHRRLSMSVLRRCARTFVLSPHIQQRLT